MIKQIKVIEKIHKEQFEKEVNELLSQGWNIVPHTFKFQSHDTVDWAGTYYWCVMEKIK